MRTTSNVQVTTDEFSLIPPMNETVHTDTTESPGLQANRRGEASFLKHRAWPEAVQHCENGLRQHEVARMRTTLKSYEEDLLMHQPMIWTGPRAQNVLTGVTLRADT